MIKYPNYLKKIFNKLHMSGASCVIVGGYIRDNFLNIASKDIDIEVYNISSFDELEGLLTEFGSVNSFGKSFGVCKLRIKDLDIDFTLPRIDSKISSGHVGFDIKIQSNLNFMTAASRRDFTINAIGYEVLNNKILDPFNGINDLKNKTLREVDKDKFSDDPLRVLRAVQFCARFDLTMDNGLFKLCKEMITHSILYELPKERVFEEIKKLLLKSTKPSIGLELLKELGAIKYFSELGTLSSNDWNHTLQTVDEIAKQEITDKGTKIVLMLAGVCYKFDEILTISFVSKLTNEKELLRKVLPLIHNHIKINQSNAELFKLATKVNIENFLILKKAIYKNTNHGLYLACDEIKEQAKELNISNKKAVAFLRGRDILACGNVPPKEFSKILEDAYEAQMNEEFSSYDEAHAWLKNHLAHFPFC